MNASSQTASPAADGRTPPRADEGTLKLVEELKGLAVDVLGRGIERMFDGADDMLFEMARRATNNKDQRVYFDTMRVVRLGRPKIGRIFREEIANGFRPEDEAARDAAKTEVHFDDLSLQESKSLEESIAISTMATKAEGLYNQLLFELNRRIDWLIKERGAPIDAKALAPATISKAFRTSAESLDVEFDIELVIFKLFDRLVISDLGELYTRALRFFDQHGVQAAAIGGGGARPVVAGGVPGGMMAGSPGAAAAAAGGPAATGGGIQPMAGVPGGIGMPTATNAYGFAAPPMVDPQTIGQLRQLGTAMVPAGGPGGVGGGVAYAGGGGGGVAYYGDPQLGADLASAASGQVVPGWEAPRAYAYVQRAGVVGRMFNDILQDPTLPGTLKPRFDQLRFSVIKNALQDSSFFADKQHPVRNLMNELATMAATARATGMETLNRIEELVGQIQGQFDVAADSIRSQTALPGPVDERVIEDFFAQQKDEARRRRQAIIERTRKVVAEELQLRTLSRRVPEGVWPLLNSGWAPMMALRLLKQGPDSEAWQDGMDLLDRILDSTDARRVASHTEEWRRTLSADIDSRLREIGMLDDRIALLIRSWRDALAEVEVVAPQPSRVPHTEALLDDIPFGDDADSAVLPGDDLAAPAATEAAPPSSGVPAAAPAAERAPAAPAVAGTDSHGDHKVPDAVTLLDLLMVLSSWFRVYDHDRRQSRWLKVVAHHPADGTVTFAEFNGQNKLQLRTQVFLDDLVGGRAEPIDLGPAAKRALDAFLSARRDETGVAAA